MVVPWNYLFIISIISSMCYGVEQCGVSIEDKMRIVGGSVASPGEFPWQVLLSIRVLEKYTPHCAGTILNKNWVLTAAHCFDKIQHPFFYILWFGKHNIKVTEGTEVSRSISKIIRHPGYSQRTMQNDIALLKLTNSLELDGKFRHLSPACLVNPSIKIDPNSCIAIGWGRLSTEGPTSDVLRKTELPIIKQETCANVYQKILNVTEGMVCAGYGYGGRGVCFGDSGGPLQCKANKIWYQVGISSWGVGCAIPNFPGVFTRVEYYNSWIKETVTSN